MTGCHYSDVDPWDRYDLPRRDLSIQTGEPTTTPPHGYHPPLPAVLQHDPLDTEQDAVDRSHT